MGIFDRFKGQSGNQAEEEQQDASQPTGGQFSDQSGYDPNQDQYGDQNQGQ